MSEQEKVADGPLGKAVGRAKQLAEEDAERRRAEAERDAANGAQVEKAPAEFERLTGEERAAAKRNEAAAADGVAAGLQRKADRAEEAAATIDPKVQYR